MSDEHPRQSGAGAAVLAHIMVGLVAKFWVWIAVAIGAAVLLAVLLWLSFYAARCVDVRDATQRALAARADQQHAWIMVGDDRGIYGEHIPERID